MEMVLLKYTGSRTLVKAAYNRKYYAFNKNNDYTESVPEKLAKDLLISGLFTVGVKKAEPVKEEITPAEEAKEEIFSCDKCDFTSKTIHGLKIHKGSHKGRK